MSQIVHGGVGSRGDFLREGAIERSAYEELRNRITRRECPPSPTNRNQVGHRPAIYGDPHSLTSLHLPQHLTDAVP